MGKEMGAFMKPSHFSVRYCEMDLQGLTPRQSKKLLDERNLVTCCIDYN